MQAGSIKNAQELCILIGLFLLPFDFEILGATESQKGYVMAKNYAETAKNVLKHIGGEGNISHLEHCSTRLRFTVNDPAKIDKPALKATDGVMGLVGSGKQCQVVIGNDVIEVYDELIKLGSFNNSGASEVKSDEKQPIGAAILDFMVGVFQPLVPAIAGAGILKAILSMLVLMGVMQAGSGWHTVLNNGADAALYFLPVMVACTMATKLNINKLVAMAVVGASILPAITTALGSDEGLMLFGYKLQSLTYAYQVFPAILTVAVLYFVEKFVTKISPKAIRVFFVPMVCFLIVVPLELIILAPLGYNIGQLLTTAILWLYSSFGWIAVALLAGILPFMISMGMHKALVPYAVSSITTTGFEMLYMPASLAHNISEGGACLAVAAKTKDENLRSAAISAGISGVFGITEPALYGVTLQHKKAMTGVVVGSVVSGIIVGLTGLKAFVAMGPGLAGMAMFVDAENAMNIVYGFMGFFAALIVSFVVTLVLYKDEAEVSSKSPEGVTDFNCISAPVDGEVVPLSEVPDDVFSGNVLGDGMAIIPSKGEIHAPADAVVTNIFETKHAIGLKLENGAELLIHVGLDTVKLNGKHFEVAVNNGDKVTKGQLLLKFDAKAIRKEGYNTIVPIIVTNSDEFTLNKATKGKAAEGAAIMTIEGVGAKTRT